MNHLNQQSQVEVWKGFKQVFQNKQGDAGSQTHTSSQPQLRLRAIQIA